MAGRTTTFSARIADVEEARGLLMFLPGKTTKIIEAHAMPVTTNGFMMDMALDRADSGSVGGGSPNVGLHERGSGFDGSVWTDGDPEFVNALFARKAVHSLVGWYFTPTEDEEVWEVSGRCIGIRLLSDPGGTFDFVVSMTVVQYG